MSIQDISRTDINELSKTGIYYAKEIKNAPVNSEMIIEHLEKLNTEDQQVIKVYPSGKNYARFKKNNMWQDWYEYDNLLELWKRVSKDK